MPVKTDIRYVCDRCGRENEILGNDGTPREPPSGWKACILALYDGRFLRHKDLVNSRELLLCDPCASTVATLSVSLTPKETSNATSPDA